MIRFLVLFLVVFSAHAVDPTIEPTKVLTCDMPIERTDGTPLALDEIAEIRFFVSTDNSTWEPAGANTVCTQTYDLTNVPDGLYYYTAQAVDTDARASAYADSTSLLVKRLAAPAPPMNLGF